jgi:2-keto-4-pentenoate hydratase/2-oxohepta-3-ene-1,7-dioic acid hydratase in catechol pathway
MSLPIPVPSKIICVGLNYKDHAEESGLALPERPLLFSKWTNTLVGPGDPILLPSITTQVDYEAELGVVIGKRASRVAAADGLDYVQGYVCANDVSARDLQFLDGQWGRGKSLDSFCPVGPMTPASAIPDPQKLRISAVLNGATLQDSNTDQMVFSVAEIIAYISQAITLEPGDLILTGTPPGVGFARKPPIFLQPGDEITIQIEGLASLTNPVRTA